jgi:hypothetical protein
LLLSYCAMYCSANVNHGGEVTSLPPAAINRFVCRSHQTPAPCILFEGEVQEDGVSLVRLSARLILSVSDEVSSATSLSLTWTPTAFHSCFICVQPKTPEPVPFRRS